jgi:hypothetical protein
MLKKVLDIMELQIAAKAFCEEESGLYRAELFGITDGKLLERLWNILFRNT